HRRHARLERVDLLDDLSERANVTVVGRTENGFGKAAEHGAIPDLNMGAPATGRARMRAESGRPVYGRQERITRSAGPHRSGSTRRPQSREVRGRRSKPLRSAG